jgi:hypothetical protein
MLLRGPHLDAGPGSKGQAKGHSQVHLCSHGRQVNDAQGLLIVCTCQAVWRVVYKQLPS